MSDMEILPLINYLQIFLDVGKKVLDGVNVEGVDMDAFARFVMSEEILQEIRTLKRKLFLDRLFSKTSRNMYRFLSHVEDVVLANRFKLEN